MRLGKRRTEFKSDSSDLRRLYGGVQFIDERHRHRYEVNPELAPQFEKKGMMFVGHDDTGKRMDIFELKDHPYFVGVQFHPEYLSRPMKPSPPFLGLILASTNKLTTYLNRGCRHSPRQGGSEYETETSEASEDEELSVRTADQLHVHVGN